MIRLEGDTIPQESRGAIVPYLFGDLIQDVHGIPLQVGFSATLATNCGIDEIEMSILLSGPDIQQTIKAVPSSGIIQIDSEWIQYVSKAIDPPGLTLASRGLGTTDPAAHSKGATVYFIEGRPIYVFAEAPPGYSYPDDAVVQIRINDNAQIPFHTVRLQDDRIVTGHRFVTVEFDLTRSFGAPPITALPGLVVISGGSDAEEPCLLDRLKCVFAWPISGGGALSGPSTQYGSSVFSIARAESTSSGHGILVKPPPVAPPAPPPPAATVQGRTATKTVGSAPVKSVVARFLQLPLGTVTADIKGLLDTPSGRITGTGFTPLLRPAHITRVCLEQTYQQDDITRFRLKTWTEAATKQAQLDYTWRLIWSGDSFESFRLNAGLCGQAELYIDEDGKWCYHFRDPQTSAIRTVTLRELENEPVLSWTNGSEVTTVLEASWGFGLQAGAFTLESAGMIKRYGRVSPKALSLPYAATEQVARRLTRYWLSQWDHQKLESDVSAMPDLLALTLTDRVFIESNLMQLYGEHRLPFEIRGTTDRGVQRMFKLVEADSLALQAILYGTIASTASLGAVLFGSLTPAAFATLYGTIDIEAGGYMADPYFGRSYYGDAYFR